MKRQIDQFFKPVRKVSKTDNSGSESGPSDDTSKRQSKDAEVRETEAGSSLPDPDTRHASASSTDIGTLSDHIFHTSSSSSDLKGSTNELKIKILRLGETFVPDESFVYPASEHAGKKLRFQKSWLSKWPWLAYSKQKDGAYCKYCVAFGREYSGKGAHQKMGTLVMNPFKKWKDAVEKFNCHSQTAYQKFAHVAADNFLKTDSGKIKDVATLLDSKRAVERERNRSFLTPIIETIIFCGENEIPLRGHRDSGPLTIEKPETKEGKFRALLRFRASTDVNLAKHIEVGARNTTYISPEVKNEIIGVCGNLIQSHIVNKVNSAACFSILGDETMDVVGKEQLSLCLRYVPKEEPGKPSILREDFISFTQITDLQAENIFNTLLNTCNNLGLDMSKIVGQGYDGCSTFSGQISGVHQRFKEQFPKAMYVHCAAHRLNLVLSDSLNIATIRNCLGTVSEVSNLLRNNVQANDLLKNNITNLVPDTKKSRLLRMCETRFVERQDAVNTFIELFPAIVVTLESLSQSNRAVSNLLSGIEKGGFIVGLLICEYLFNITLPLAKYLQKPECDLSSAVQYADDVISTLRDLRECEGKDLSKFSEIFERAETLSKENFNVPIMVPRQAAKQTKRENPPHDSPEEYFRRSMFIPCIDTFISGLQERFENNRSTLEGFDLILPRNINPQNVKELKKLNIYYEDRASYLALEAEYLLWCKKWETVPKEDRPKRVLPAIDSCDQLFYPTIYYLLQVLATLPVSTAEVERSFSSLKRIKTYLRNAMLNDRLTGLALLSIHYPAPITATEVIDAMARSGQRRLIL